MSGRRGGDGDRFCTTWRRDSAFRAVPRGSAITAVCTMDACGAAAGAGALSGSAALWTTVTLCAVSLLADTATNTQTRMAVVAEATNIRRCQASMKSPPDAQSPYDIHTSMSKITMPACSATCGAPSTVPAGKAPERNKDRAVGRQYSGRQKRSDEGPVPVWGESLRGGRRKEEDRRTMG